MPCLRCAKRERCKVICPRLEALLPKLNDSVTQGHVRDEKSLRNVLDKRGATRELLGLRRILKGHERGIVNLVFNSSLTHEEAARQMHTSVERVRRVLAHAYRRMERKLSSGSERKEQARMAQ